jgi:15-cis-phytoene synthase
VRAPEPGPARALACLYSPPAQRELLQALCALEREIGASLAPGLEHQVAHTRLSWWREECQRCIEGMATHPITRVLAARLPPHARRGLNGLVDTAIWDLAAATFETRRELLAYCERWSAAMILSWTQLAAPTADAGALRALGAALRETELLLQLPTEARAGRVRLPLDELERAQVPLAALASPPWPQPLAQLLQERYTAVRATLGTPLAAAPGRPALRALAAWSGLAEAQAQRAAGCLPHAPPAGARPTLRDAWRAWRSARRAGRSA